MQRLKRAVLVSFGVGKNKENLTDKARADVRGIVMEEHSLYLSYIYIT